MKLLKIEIGNKIELSFYVVSLSKKASNRPETFRKIRHLID